MKMTKNGTKEEAIKKAGKTKGFYFVFKCAEKRLTGSKNLVYCLIPSFMGE